MDPDAQIAKLTASQHGVATYQQLKALRVSPSVVRHRVSKGRLVEMHPGVYRLRGAPVTTRMRVVASVLSAGEGACASHRTAAALFGLPGFQLSSFDVTVPVGRRPRTVLSKIHYSTEMPAWHRRTIDAIPTTSLARTLFDLCGVLHPRRAERALDTALARRIVTVPACWRVLADLAEHGRGGTVLMREMLTVRGTGYVAPASELEAHLLRILRDAGLPEPAREIDLGDADGWVGRVELVYREARVLIEADSRLHHSSLTDRRADMERDNRFTADGWHILRFDWEQITQRAEHVARTVRRALDGIL